MAICTHCGKTIEDAVQGTISEKDTLLCEKCKETGSKEKETITILPEQLSRLQHYHVPAQVIVTDIKMPFISMVVFIIKWVVAAIPAFIIIFILGILASYAVVGLLGITIPFIPHR
jgi:hypothetical protein